MMYAYRARTSDNTLVQGLVEGVSADAAAEVLIARGLSILDVQEYRLPFWKRSVQPWPHVKIRDLVVFFRQLSVLISASVPIVQSLRILTGQITSVALKKAVTQIAEEVEGGAKLSAAMARHPRIFFSLHRSLVQTGETSGKLDEVVDYLALQEERNYDLLSRVRGAMIYPLITVTMLIG